MNVSSLIRNYYLATPLFLILDAVFGVNIRAAGFEAYPAMKWGYYGLCLLCMGAVIKLPSISSLVGMLESGANVLSLIVGLLGPYYAMAANAGTDEFLAQPPPITPERVTSFILAGAVALVSFYRSRFNRTP